ncbi:MAG: hypothetical protein MJ252_15565 [archaeon]|nr:hypothetical protein [archaeon]
MQSPTKTHKKRISSPVKKAKKEESKNPSQLDPSSYSKSNVIVAIRCRPLNENELKLSSVETVKILNGNVICIVETIDSVNNKKTQQTKEQQFFYDIVFDQKATQMDVYSNSTKFLLSGIMDGFNATVLAYGATGSGKTYTMLGTQTEPGIMQRAVSDLFSMVKKNKTGEFKIKLSYIEVYNELIHDLLGDASQNLDIREDPSRGVIINGVKEIDLDNADNFFTLLLLGNSKRATEVTNTNATSSRSHAVLQIFLENKNKEKNEITMSRFVLCDLAGSEKSSTSGATGARQLEASKINQSLLNLGKCINALADNRNFVSWRDSKLTRILKDSLIGNSRMVMLSTISPSIFSITETINTLLYSSRAKNIQVKVKRNTVDVEDTAKYEQVISGLVKELDNLRYQLAVKTHNQYLAPQQNKAKTPNACSKEEKLFKEISMHFNEEIRMKNEIFEIEKTMSNISLSVKEKEFQLFKSINKSNNKFKNNSPILSMKDKEIKSQINKLNEQLNIQKNLLEEKEAKYDEFTKKRETFEKQIAKMNNDKEGPNLNYLYNGCVYEINNMTNEHIRRQNLTLLKQKELKIQKLLEQIKIRDEYINNEKTEIANKKINFKYENEDKIKNVDDLHINKNFSLPVVMQQNNANESFNKTRYNSNEDLSNSPQKKVRFQSAGQYDYSGYNNPNIIKQKQVFKTKTNEIMNINKKNELTQLKLNILNDLYKGSKVVYVNKKLNKNNPNLNEENIVINFDTKPLNKSQSNISLNDSGSADNSRLGMGINDREILNKVKRVMIGKKKISPYMK